MVEKGMYFMDELTNVCVQYEPVKITDNLETVKQDIKKICDDYTALVITEENLKDGTEALAIIRSKKKAIDDERKEIKKQWNAPYLAWEEKVKEITGICDQAIENIKGKMQDYEDRRIEERMIVIQNIYDQLQKEHSKACEYLSLEEIKNEPSGQKTGAKTLGEKWLLKTYDIPVIRMDQEKRILKIEEDLARIGEMQSKYEADALKTYRITKSYAEAVATVRNMEENERRILEEERKRREAEERARAVREAEEQRRREEEALHQQKLLEEAQEREKRAREEAELAEQRRREEEAKRIEAEKHAVKIPPKAEESEWDWEEPAKEKEYKFLCKVPESVKDQFARICEEGKYPWQAKEA